MLASHPKTNQDFHHHYSTIFVDTQQSFSSYQGMPPNS